MIPMHDIKAGMDFLVPRGSFDGEARVAYAPRMVGLQLDFRFT